MVRHISDAADRIARRVGGLTAELREEQMRDLYVKVRRIVQEELQTMLRGANESKSD